MLKQHQLFFDAVTKETVRVNAVAVGLAAKDVFNMTRDQGKTFGLAVSQALAYPKKLETKLRLVKSLTKK